MIQEADSSFSILLAKLQEFISKYYLQKILKGVLQLCLVFITLYLISTSLEYNLYFGTAVRTFFFWAVILGIFGLFVFWVVIPLYHFLNYRTRMDAKQASLIIGDHFPEVQDKLLNVLTLNEMKSSHPAAELIEASINQKSNGLVFVRFNEAIDWAKNRKLGRYLILPLFILGVILVFSPSFLLDSTHRIVHYDQTFSRKAPFQFVLTTQNLKVPQFESIEIRARLKGKSLPEDLNLVYNDRSFPMRKDKEEYVLVLKVMERTSRFRFETLGYYSDEYKIEVMPKGLISDFEVKILPPAYTGLKSTVQKNVGDISAPEGSNIIWNYKTEHIDQLQLLMNQHLYPAEKTSVGFQANLILKSASDYTIFYQNKHSKFPDSQQYSISLIKDEFPLIAVREFKDSLNDILYYAGEVSDDYRLSALKMIVQSAGKISKYKIAIPNAKNASFHFSTKDIFKQIQKGTSFTYYFEVWDNDGIHGPKSSRSSVFQSKSMSENEIQKLVQKNSLDIQSDLKRSVKDAKEIQRELEEAKKKILQKSSLDFNDKKAIEQLVEKQKELQNRLETIKDEMDRNFEKRNELSKQENGIQEQQKQLEELIEQMKSPAYEELLQKVQDLMQKMDKKEMMSKMEIMDSKSEKMEKNMDRLLQIYKNLDYKQKVNDAIESLDKLAKEQEKAALETELKKNTSQRQKELLKETKEMEKKMEELKKLNKDLNKTDSKDFEEMQKDIQEAEQKQENADHKLSDNDLDEAAKEQREAKNKLNDAKDKLKKLKKKQKKNQKAEDARMMRRVLQNVIHLSFEQEKLVDLTKTLSIQAPSYTTIAQKQKKLLEDFKIVEDTLFKIASRQVKVRKFIFEEVDHVNSRSKRALEHLVQRQSGMAISEEQFAMAGYNKLGLMISESLKNIEEDEDDEDGMEGGETCDNPKKSKKAKKTSMSMDKLAEMQQQLNEQMQQLENRMKEENGKSPKESGQGQKGESKPQGSKQGDEAKEWARIAAQQQAIRNALKKLEEQSNLPDKSGKKPFGERLNELMEKMTQTEKELVNRKIYAETIKRQKEIQVKLLESSKAQHEQEEESRRESQKAKSIPPEMPKALKNYLEEKRKNEKQIERAPIELTPYFRTLAEKYFELIKQ